MNTLRTAMPAVQQPALRVAAVAAAVAALTIGGATASWAHVHVIPDTTASGGYAKLTFRVPDESETASTTEVSVALPTKTPLTYASAQPVAGWTVSVEQGNLPEPVTVEGTTITKGPVEVTWKAQSDDDGIAPSEFQEFSISAGPLPAEATELGFPTTQTYSDGTVVTWNQPETAGGEEPENPLPAFTVTAADAEDARGGDTHDEAASSSTDDASAGDDSSNGVAIGLGAAGLVAGMLGLGAGGVALRRSGPAGEARN